MFSTGEKDRKMRVSTIKMSNKNSDAMDGPEENDNSQPIDIFSHNYWKKQRKRKRKSMKVKDGQMMHVK